MDIETVRAKMMEQVETAIQSSMTCAFGWVFEVHDLVVLVTLCPRCKRDRVYLIRIAFEDFPKQAPSYLFVDRETKQIKADAWPPNVGHGNPPTAICTPGTREFHQHLHRNDAQYAWDPKRLTVLATLHEIHRMIERGIS